METKKHSRGFSLIEMVLYIAILVLMLWVILQVVTAVVRSERLVRSARVIENSAALSFERVTREVRHAESITTASSTFNIHPGKLTLSGTDDSGNPRTVEFSLSSGRLELKEDDVSSGFLTESSTTVTSLVFRRFATSTVEGVRMEMTVESGTSTHYRTETFYSSALLR